MENYIPLLWNFSRISRIIGKGIYRILKRVKGDTFNNRYDDIENMLVNGLNQRWFNTIMSTLYMMEEDLMEMSSDSVFILWDILFTCQALRKENNVVAMGLNIFELKGR